MHSQWLCRDVRPALTRLDLARILAPLPMPAAPPLPLTDLLRALAHAGASDSLLGQAVRELVVSKAAPDSLPQADADLASPQPAPAAAQVAPAPTGAVTRFAGNPVHGSGTARGFAGIQSKPVQVAMLAEPVVVNFRRNGKRSSVYFTPARWAELVHEIGSEQATMDLVKQYAAVAPDQGNRSAWVQNAVRRSGGRPPDYSGPL